jgi:hypothetical protein
MNNYLLIGSRYGLRALDVTTPSHPTLVGTQTAPGDIIQIATDNQHVYAAYNDFYGNHGFLILDFVPPTIAGRVTDGNNLPVPNVTLTLNTGLAATTNISGSYAFSPLQWMTYTVTPTLPGYVFWPPAQTVTLPPATESVNFVRLALPTWITVTAGSRATLAYTDTQGLPTTLVFPASAFSQTTTMALTPTIVFPPARLGFTGHAFDLAAYRSGVPLANLVF